ncbi:MAG: DUF4260 domain-containing protein [Sphingobacteriales bacterium]|nr:DUF4260 domain-containing protein [Sphingobacteriales bacterium]
MKNVLKLEELAMLALSIVLFNQLHFVWWWFLVLFFAPDISMLGYLVNTKIGAYSYNFFHHKAVAIAVGLLGFYLQNEIYMLTGIILFGHSSFDRILGYGLKYTDSFKNTHLGKL